MLWAETVALYAGIASVGDQARYYPPPSVEQGAHEAEIVDTRRIVPSPGLPLDVLTSNNNLDVVRHGGRVYLAFRTAPDHFAGPDTRIHVVSSDDEVTWRTETAMTLGTDLREPRFFSWNEQLMLFVSKLGTDRYNFEPQGVLAIELKDKLWSLPRHIDLPGHIVWRTKVERDVPLMTAYVGGENIYRFNGEPLEVKLLTTADGYEWRPLQVGEATVYRGGGSETAFTSDDDGNLYTVVRNEAGDDSGWGSSVCFAPAAEWTNWDCVNDPKKYDSPVMFTYDNEVYLIGRRNVTEDGRYDQDFGPALLRNITNQLDYVTRAKRCSLWRYVKSEQRVAFVLDLPSKGDTCFPSVINGKAEGEFVIYNYSSDIQGADVPWSVGQREPTLIYRHTLQLRRDPAP
jgi:hypothetical protein